MSYKGRFKPKNTKKYRGDHTSIIYRSLWELRFMRYCDEKPSILMWASEEVIIPYRSPIDGKVHRYFPDFWIRVKTANGSIQETLIEVKPKAQTRPPTGGPPKDGRKRRRYISEVRTWGVNEAKWRAAQAFCDSKGWKFQILTEDDLTKF